MSKRMCESVCVCHGVCAYACVYVYAMCQCLRACVCALANSDYKMRLAAKFARICQCSVAFFLQVPKLCTDLDQTVL